MMRSGVQHEYDYLKGAVPLRAKLEGRKLDAISTAAGRMYNLSREMGTYEHDLQASGKNSEDLRFFRTQVLQLNQSTQDLQDAALRRNLENIGTSFDRLGRTCSACHLRFGVKGTDGAAGN
jgi:cytochrome c556